MSAQRSTQQTHGRTITRSGAFIKTSSLSTSVNLSSLIFLLHWDFIHILFKRNGLGGLKCLKNSCTTLSSLSHLGIFFSNQIVTYVYFLSVLCSICLCLVSRAYIRFPLSFYHTYQSRHTENRKEYPDDEN